MVTPEEAREPMAIHGLNKDYGKSIRGDKGVESMVLRLTRQARVRLLPSASGMNLPVYIYIR